MGWRISSLWVWPRLLVQSTKARAWWWVPGDSASQVSMSCWVQVARLLPLSWSQVISLSAARTSLCMKSACSAVM
ncbi:hypothetical protein CA984_10055 [Streptosporangium minutum]|uniref:Uncharacterized protein n=1 Tax=Streptosporangium minutum TaxID=569862 RepID=A0A243RRU1_9ACTN|nr:hypothetical protein CA984_10055 [Streptosporangium minutum]